jgi:hypothetical protein
MQHALTSAQIVEIKTKYGDNVEIVDLKNFSESLFSQLSNISVYADLSTLAYNLICTINLNNFDSVILPIGSPAFMYTLASRNDEIYADKLFAHSERVSKEVTNDDGTVTKTNVFNHVSFITIV